MTLLNVLTTPLCFVPNLLEGEDNFDVLFRLVTSYTAIHGVPLQYVLAKFYIYQNKFISRNISIQGFINLLKKKMLSEKYISFIKNRLSNFFKKWSPLHKYFFPIVSDE